MFFFFANTCVYTVTTFSEQQDALFIEQVIDKERITSSCTQECIFNPCLLPSGSWEGLWRSVFTSRRRRPFTKSFHPLPFSSLACSLVRYWFRWIWISPKGYSLIDLNFENNTIKLFCLSADVLRFIRIHFILFYFKISTIWHRCSAVIWNLQPKTTKV